MSQDQLATSSLDITYDRSALRRSIVHIGVGGFHRAHLATYIDELCRAGRTDWSIVGAGVLPADARMADALDAQDGIYRLIVRGAEATTVSTIGSIVDYVLAWPDSAPLIERIAQASTQIVSLTVTEGGYPVNDTDGSFDASSPNAAADSAFGILTAALDQRRSTGGGPLTILSCDNVISNGAVARTALLGCVELHADEELATWVRQHVSFPNSMVDRITPATTSADSEWLRSTRGIEDAWPVVTEPFRQWVIEDDFAGDRLPLEAMPVIATTDVEPYELMKLRLLNAGHSCLAYLSALLGIDTVAAAMAEPAIRGFLERFYATEAQAALPDIPGVDVDAYIASLLERFSNPQIADQISRLCLDGSAKFPKFLVPTIRVQLERNGPIEGAALALAGWCHYLNGQTETDDPIRLASDPQLDTLVAAAGAARSEASAFLDLEFVFGNLRESPSFGIAFSQALEGLRSNGVRSTIDQYLSM